MEQVADRVPYRNPLAIVDYAELSKSYREWIPDVLELQRIEAELETLTKTERELRGLRPTRSEFKEALRVSFERYRQRHLERLGRFLAENVSSRDCLSRVERLQHVALPPIALEDFIAAEAMLPDEIFGAAPDKVRASELKKVSKRREALELRRGELAPPPYLRLDKMGVLRDVRQLFVNEWIAMQRKTREPVDACGLGLRHCDESVKWAYAELGISAYLNEKTGKLAAVP